MSYLDRKWGVGPVGAPDDVLWLYDDGITGEPLVTAADISGAQELREQSDIYHDPDDPNLATHPEREWKFYVSAPLGAGSDDKRLFVLFSADGETFGAPTRCVMGGSDRTAEDPSAVVHWSAAQRGVVHRDGDGKMHLYVEDSATGDIYVYEGTDGINFTEMSGNPVVARGGTGTWDAQLVGSPYAVHDGTNYILGYEGIDQPAPGATEGFGIASGANPNALTKSANNPVWDPGPDPHASATIVVDSFFLNDAEDEVIVLAHAGGPAGTTSMWRGTTSNTDPTTWESGDITTKAGDLDEYLGLKNDITLDHHTGDMTVVITGTADDQSLVRYRLYGATKD